MSEMNPLQRLETARWPCGFDSNLLDIPDWFTKTLPEDYINTVVNQGPMAYLANRAGILSDSLEKMFSVTEAYNQNFVDQIISYAERLYLVSMPKGTSIGWLTVLLNYGHSVSGVVDSNEDKNLIFDFIEKNLNIKVGCLPTTADRNQPNSRWVIKYTEGIMDTDAITE